MVQALQTMVVSAAMLFALPLAVARDARPAQWTVHTVATGPRALDRVDVYAPNDGQRHPALLFVHGGAWMVKRPSADSIGRFEAIARQENWVLGIAYFPTTKSGHKPLRKVEAGAVAADLQALRGLRGVQANNVAIYGESSGGQLGALVAYAHPSEVAAVVSASGPADMTVEDHAPYVRELVRRYEGETPARSAARHDGRYRRTSPADRVTPESPPTFAFADRDDPLVPSQQLRELGNRLAAAHVDYRVMIMPGTTHCPEDQTVAGGTSTAEDEALRFIRQAENR